MFAFSYRSYGRVPDDLPDFFDDFLRCFFQAASPLQSRRQLYNKRVTWAQAEMFVAHKLSLGYHPDCLEDKVQEEVNISSYTGSFHPLFLQYCLRILYNIRRAGQFADFWQEIEGRGSGAVDRDGSNINHMSGNRFSDSSLVGRYGMDDEIEREIGQCDCLDKETEEALQDMRKQLHREAEQTWHAKAAEVLDNGDDRHDNSQGRYSRSSSPRARDTRRVGFPDEPTMTESSASGPRGDSGNLTTYNLNTDRRRCRSRPRSTPFHHNMKSDSNTRRVRSDSIRPGDSVSQLMPNYNSSRGADFSRLRANSPPNTSNQSNDGFSSRVPSSYVSDASEWGFAKTQSSARLRRDSPRRRGDDLRSMFKDLRVKDDRPHESRGRRNEKRSDGRDSRERQSSIDSHNSDSTIVDRSRNVSRIRVKGNSNHRGRGRSPSTDFVVTVTREKSHKSRGKEKEKKRGFGRSARHEEQSQVDDRESRPRYRSDSRINATRSYEFPQHGSSRTPQILKDRYHCDSEHRSDISLRRSSRKPERQESRHRERSVSQSRHRPSKRDAGPPLAYDKYKNFGRQLLRDQGKSPSRSQSRPAASVLTQTDSYAGESSRIDRSHQSKWSKNCLPLKRP